MSSNYPSGYDSFTTHHDNAGERVTAADINKIQDAVAAVQQGVGLNPANAYAKVIALTPSGDATGVVDTAAIQAALNSANTAGGGMVFLAAGTYYLNAPVIFYSRTRIVGSGRFSTIIQLANGKNCDALTSYQFSSLTGGNTSGGVVGVTLEHLTIDGNKANNPTGGAGVKYYGSMLAMTDVIVRNCKGDGIYSEWSNSAVSVDGCEGHLKSVVTHDNGGNGIAWAGPHDSVWVSCMSFLNGAKGFWIKSSSAIHVAIGCHSWGANQTYGWYLEGETHLIGCQGEGASVAQVMVGQNDCVIEGGKYFGIAGHSLVGIQLGDAAHTGIAGVQIQTKTFNCEGGCLDFTYHSSGGYSRVSVDNFQTAGTVYLGPVNPPVGINLTLHSGGVALPAGVGFNFSDPVTYRSSLSVVGGNTKFNVNQSAGEVGVPNGAYLRGYSDAFATTTFRIEGSTGHWISGGVTPAAAAASAAGTGATVSISGNDMAGTITLTTGVSPSTGTQVNVTFAAAFAVTPRSVRFAAESGVGALLSPYCSSRATTGFGFALATAPAASTSYTFTYAVTG